MPYAINSSSFFYFHLFFQIMYCIKFSYFLFTIQKKYGKNINYLHMLYFLSLICFSLYFSLFNIISLSHTHIISTFLCIYWSSFLFKSFNVCLIYIFSLCFLFFINNFYLSYFPLFLTLFLSLCLILPFLTFFLLLFSVLSSYSFSFTFSKLSFHFIISCSLFSLIVFYTLSFLLFFPLSLFLSLSLFHPFLFRSSSLSTNPQTMYPPCYFSFF